jgi:hypothetical protein
MRVPGFLHDLKDHNSITHIQKQEKVIDLGFKGHIGYYQC